jgi:2-polyprenyl-6-methoxyphenol hydroxylase-like FAD-dependent oxidoreductase
MTSKVSVLIVGAGPAGLTMAIELYRRGISFRIIDKQLKPIDTSNALVLHARTLEIWKEQGILDKALQNGVIIKAIEIYDNDKHLLHLGFDSINSMYPFALCYPQSETEKLLLDYLTQHTISVEMQTDIIDLQNKPDSITCKLKNSADEIEEVHCDWLIASDGAHSYVRNALNIPFDGKNTSQHFIIADFNSRSPLLSRDFFIFLSDDGPLMITQFHKDRCRLVAEVSQDPDLKEAQSASVEQLKNIVTKRCPYAFDTSDPTWISGFTVRERLIKTYQQHHVFFIGDSAHVHSPAGGQGLNLGIQDAYNLAWKLALVIQQKSDPALLTTYEAERRPVAKSVLTFTNKLTDFMSTQNSLYIHIRRVLLKLIARYTPLKKRIVSTFSQTNLGYQYSTLTKDYLSLSAKPIAGSSVFSIHFDKNQTLLDLISGTRFCILIFSGNYDVTINQIVELETEIEYEHPGMFKFIFINKDPYFHSWKKDKIFDENAKIHDSYQIRLASIYVIRPDKYIGFRGNFSHQEKLMHYIKTILLS